jgi:hypothetical protein
MQQYEGTLEIDQDTGIATFTTRGLVHGSLIRVLRVTHLPTPVPEGVSIDLVAIRNVTSYTPLEISEQDEHHDPATCLYGHIDGVCAGDAFQLAKGERKTHIESFQEWLDDDITPVERNRCPRCTKVHTSADYTKWGSYTLIVSHEYIVWTRTSQQTYAHRGRMQYLGQGRSPFKYQLTFNARGPDRSTSARFGGTQMIDARNIVKLEEVDLNPGKRYADEIDRDMKRELCTRARTQSGTMTTYTSCGDLPCDVLHAAVIECLA